MMTSRNDKLQHNNGKPITIMWQAPHWYQGLYCYRFHYFHSTWTIAAISAFTNLQALWCFIWRRIDSDFRYCVFFVRRRPAIVPFSLWYRSISEITRSSLPSRMIFCAWNASSSESVSIVIGEASPVQTITAAWSLLHHTGIRTFSTYLFKAHTSKRIQP